MITSNIIIICTVTIDVICILFGLNNIIEFLELYKNPLSVALNTDEAQLSAVLH